MNYFLGIDNGKTGGISVIDEKLNVIYSAPTPLLAGGEDYDINEIRGILATYNHICKPDDALYVALEDCSSAFAPANGKKAVAGAFYSFGLYTGILESYEIKYRPIAPMRWQSDILGKVPTGKTKEAAAAKCIEIWPDYDLRASERARTPHAGKADSLLLAYWACRSWTHAKTAREVLK